MLTAWDKVADTTVALPDFEETRGLESLRARTREGALVCPTCRQPLWLRAGAILVAHFAHRRLSECPHGRVSELVLAARRLVYRFFQTRIERAKLPAAIQLEPVLEGLPAKHPVDLLLRREKRPWVTVVIVESRIDPDARVQLPSMIRSQKWIFRPLFLSSRLNPAPDEPHAFLLDPTQREFRISTPYDLRLEGLETLPGTLHFIDPRAAAWTALRGLSLAHEPQVFQARAIYRSAVDHLLWSEAHSDWAHPGEAEALKALREAMAARRRQEAAKRLEERKARSKHLPAEPQFQSPPIPVAPHRFPPAPLQNKRPITEPIRGASDPAAMPRPEPLPEWLRKGLVCVGCGKRTTAWQNANPGKAACVCRACFAAGTRLPG